MAVLSDGNGMVLAGWAQSIEASALQEMLTVTARPEIISFALGLPAPELFPVQQFGAAAAQVLAADPRSLQYGPAGGALKQYVVGLMAQRGVICEEEQVFLTAGAQQGMNLLAHLLLEPGGGVVLEQLIYTGFQQVLAPFQPQRHTVGSDPQTGMDVEAVAALLAQGVRPAFLYAMSDGHNPLSVSMSAEKRQALVALAQTYQIPILEDDAYGFLSYEPLLPPLRALDAAWVCYVGSFSKILAPALRVGWVIVPPALVEKLAFIKEASDINTATFPQRAVSAFLEGGYLPAHLSALRAAYQNRRDTMLRALQANFPPEARWHAPAAGLFVWVELPPTYNTTLLLKIALETERVAFLPSEAFWVAGQQPPKRNALRLNFSNSTPERIEEGIARLARILPLAEP